MIGNISIIGFIVAVTVSVGCMITGLWMLFSRKYKHDPRNPIGTAIAMLLMPLGLGLLAFNEIGFFPARYYRILIVIGIGLGGGGAELLTLSIVHVCRKGGKKKDARTGIVGACLCWNLFPGDLDVHDFHAFCSLKQQLRTRNPTRGNNRPG